MIPSMRRLLLINPNSNRATTEMMVALAQAEAGAGAIVAGATATRAPAMITDPAALDAAAAEVVEIGIAQAGGHDGLIVAAFGDPGLAELRARVAVPVAGIAEAAMLAAARDKATGGGRRFGVATTTPDLAPAIAARAAALGLAAQFTGIRLTQGDPHVLTADPAALREALALCVRDCIGRDGAEAVIIGGGPLAASAAALQSRFQVPVVAPVAEAVRWLVRR